MKFKVLAEEDRYSQRSAGWEGLSKIAVRESESQRFEVNESSNLQDQVSALTKFAVRQKLCIAHVHSW